MYKDILVPYVNAGSERAPAATAIALAEAFEAHVAMLVTVDVPAPMPSDWGAMAYDLYARLHEEARTRARARAEALREKFAHADVPFELRIAEAVSLYPQNAASLQARYADLTVLPTMPRDSAENMLVHDYFYDILRHSGRPVLVVPEGNTAALPPKRAVIAWKPTREASRAVADAMPLLRMADAIDVLVIDPVVGEAAHGGEPGADIAAHLARHGLKVEVVTRPSMNFSVTYALLEYARTVGADLIVAGGYGHSRLREALLGGTTRELLQTTHLPVLFSH
ncbi:MAG: universal stress protein [Xanthomonadales bacterium]|nr:universal stress protein [Xanthomonadales bacterium]